MADDQVTDDVQDDDKEEKDEPEGDQPADFDSWLTAQPDDVKTRINTRLASQQSALNDERKSRKELDKKLRGLSKQLEEGSDARKAVDGLRADLKTQSQRADFYEAAHREGVTNLRLAYVAAQDQSLINEDGDVDFAKLKETNPELFGQKKAPTPPGKAGSGTNTTPKRTTSMNDWIRAGR